MKANPIVLYAVAGVAAIAALYFVGKKGIAAVGDAAKAVGTAVNPVSENNLVNKGANAITNAIAGNESSIGVRFWEWMNPQPGINDNAAKFAVGSAKLPAKAKGVSDTIKNGEWDLSIPTARVSGTLASGIPFSATAFDLSGSTQAAMNQLYATIPAPVSLSRKTGSIVKRGITILE